ncbi:MAG: prenyltransferase/squalene oxidase repeat-containing protein [Gaiellaceae bacterium]
MGLKGLAAAAAACAALVTVGSVEDAARFLEGRQQAGGGYAEPGGRPTPGLTAWTVLGLRAAGRPAAELADARAYLTRSAPELESLTDAELVLAALAALGDPPATLVERVRAAHRPSGAIGPALNSTVWGLISLRAAGEPAPAGSVRFLLGHQHRSGGWSWAVNAGPDSNDTAAAVLALRAAGVRGAHPALVRARRYLRGLQNPDGGFELVPRRGSDVQSTAWAVQALLAAGAKPGAGAFGYLERMRRPDGSLRYSARYAVTPVWVTAQALPALARKPLPLSP